MVKVSVIVPNYNHNKFLQKRIDSILSQTFQDFELIILDDCSNDNSQETIESYRNHSKVKWIEFNHKNSGSPFSQWKKGIELSSGEYIWIAESDDFNTENFLADSIKILDSNPILSLVFCQSNIVDFSGQVIGDASYWTGEVKIFDWSKGFIVEGNKFIINALVKLNVIVNSSAVVFRHEFVADKQLGLERYFYCGDWLFWGLLSQDKLVAFMPEKNNYFRQHSETTRNLIDFPKYLNRIIEEISVRSQLMNLMNLGLEGKSMGNLWDIVAKSASIKTYQTINKKIESLSIRKPLFWDLIYIYYSFYNVIKFHFFRRK